MPRCGKVEDVLNNLKIQIPGFNDFQNFYLIKK